MRDAVVPLATFWLTPSDQVMLNGAAPVSVAVMVAEPPLPAQYEPPPLTAAVGRALLLTVVGALCALQPFASVKVTL